MELKVLIILIMVGAMSGFISGLLGVGGGIIIIPTLMLLLNYNQLQAQGTAIAILLFPIGIMAFLTYYRKGYINMSHAIIIAAAFVVFAYFGSKLAININIALVRKIFAIFIFIVAIRIFFLK